MAFPSVVATATSTQDNHANPVNINLPSGIQSGDIILIAIRTHVGPTVGDSSIISGYTHLVSRNWGGYTGVFYKVATGSEGSTASLNLGVNAKSTHIAYLIRGNTGNIHAVMNTGNVNDPPSITASWGAVDNLFVSIMTNRPSNSSVTGAPSGYSNLITIANPSSNDLDTGRVSMAYKTATSASDDAGAFTASGLGEPHSVSVVIEGAAVGPVAPTANFTASVTSGYDPLEVTFTDTSSGTPTSWAWTFGDGGTSTSQNPTHTYNDPGTYDVSLVATNAEGNDTETKTGYIIVAEPPTNTLTDPSFEAGAAGWAVYGANISLETTISRTGSNSLRLEPWEVWGGTYFFLPTPALAVQQTFGAWFRSDALNAGRIVNVIIKNEDTGAITKSPDYTLTTSWQYGEVTLTPSAGANLSVQVQGANLNTSGYVYIDDVSHYGALEPDTVPETFEWKGFTWQRRTNVNFGHGQPMFNGKWSKANVPEPTVDGLLLKLTNSTGSSPVGAEIRSVSRDFGYGTYISVVNTNLTGLYPSVVFGGLFTFDENQPPAYDEIDVHESSAWGETRPLDFTGVQLMHNMWRPLPDNTDRWVEETYINMPNQALQTHRLIWEPGKMTTDSFLGEGTGGTLIMHNEFTDVPVPSQTRVHYNLWVIALGTAPEAATPVDVLVKDFSYTPASSGIQMFNGTSWVPVTMTVM